jgi:hypothetical protein
MTGLFNYLLNLHPCCQVRILSPFGSNCVIR